MSTCLKKCFILISDILSYENKVPATKCLKLASEILTMG